VGDTLVAGPEDHRRRVALIDEQAHIGAVGLAPELRFAPQNVTDDRRKPHGQGVIGRDARGRKLAAGQLDCCRMLA